MTHLLYRLCLLVTAVGFSFCNHFNEHEILRISYEFSGCFGSEISKLTLYKKSNSTIARLEVKGEQAQERSLNSTQVNAVYDFVERVRQLEEGGSCTNVSSFTIYTEEETVKKVDEGCRENGYPDLKMVLFNHY